jgi:hypothetical protein
MGNDTPVPVRKPHRRTGKPPGAKPGNQQTLKHGLWSAKFVAHRAVVTTALREARRLARPRRRLTATCGRFHGTFRALAMSAAEPAAFGGKKNPPRVSNRPTPT